ncbi:hypothetical protein MNAN1_000366 [Malassezia nana]|uniref:Uncharacterized protein n=1 Tax=Malassezia nana TaxID=180528 RepID=A0AAF0EJA9_9BASI|nr:hypothetical protein MNAN1_000366 [Malassezia nana]
MVHSEAIVKPKEAEAPAKTKPPSGRNKTLTLGVLKSDRKEPTKKNRHISFNTLVEQCIALEENPRSYFYDEYSDEDDEEDEEDHYAHENIHSLLSPPKQSKHIEKASDKPATIAMISPTHLKTGHEYLLPNYDDVLDGDEEQASELNMRYSVADTEPEMHDLPLDQDDGYDYYDSDEILEGDEPPAYSYSSSKDVGTQGTYGTHL